MLVRNMASALDWPFNTESGATRSRRARRDTRARLPADGAQPGESSLEFLARVDAVCERGDERVGLFVALRDSGQLGPAEPLPREIMH